MRYPLDIYGFSSPWREIESDDRQNLSAKLDLRGASDPEVLRFLTIIPVVSQAQPVEVRHRDLREDTQVVYFPRATRFQPILDRFPARGPVQLEVGGLEAANPTVGFYELEGDTGAETVLTPFEGPTPGAGTFLLPLHVYGASEGPVTLSRVREGLINISLFLHAAEAADFVDFTFTPEARPDRAESLHVVGGTPRFVRVLDRIPVLGPGTLTMDVHVTTGPVAVYGFFSD